LEDDAPHVLGGDLKVPAKDAIAQDNPALYFYWVHILELEKEKSHDKSKGASKSSDKDSKMVGSLMEVQCGMMRYRSLFHAASMCWSDVSSPIAVTAFLFPSRFSADLFAIV